MRNDLLVKIVIASGGVVTNANNRNSLINDINVANGSVRYEHKSRNELLEDAYQNALSGGEFDPAFTQEFS
tara:strand:- start:42 stop:254 length:213 start_codon:yes stop_codon:yes gene_type:complete